jgi:CBS domain-containing protein
MQARNIMMRYPRSCFVHDSIKDVAVTTRKANVGKVAVVDAGRGIIAGCPANLAIDHAI